MKDLLKQRTILYVGIAILLIGVSSIITNSSSSADVKTNDNLQQLDRQPITITSNASGTVISYPGVEGRTALNVLKDGAEVITKDSSFGEYVTTINGVEQTSSEFWLFYINGKQANVGAGDYITKGGDNVEWRLEG